MKVLWEFLVAANDENLNKASGESGYEYEKKEIKMATILRYAHTISALAYRQNAKKTETGICR